MAAVALLLWHAAFAALSLVLHQLSMRLGRALADNDRYLPLYLAGAGLLLISGVMWLFRGVCGWVELWAPIIGILGGGASAAAALSCWGWLPAEIRKTQEEGKNGAHPRH